jgi:hypothetical protein
VGGRASFNILGDVQIPLRFHGISHFKDGICRVGSETRVGYIDHSGQWVIEPRFLIGMDFSEGRTFISDDGETFRLIDMSGAAIGREVYDRARVLHSGLAPVMKDRLWGFVDKNGRITIPFTFEDALAQHFLCGLAAVKIGGKWGFIDRIGDFVIKPYFEQVLPFSEGLAPVKLDAKWGVIDLAGGVRLQPTWDMLGQFVGGLAAARRGGLAGFIKPDGHWAIDPIFDAAKAFYGDLAIVRVGDAPAYVRVDGTIVWKFEPHVIVPRPPAPD